MTTKELNRFYYLKKQIKQLHEEIQKLEDLATSTTAAISGTSGGGPSDKICSAVVAITEKKERLTKLYGMARAELKKIQTWIDAIEDPMIRDMFRYRYEECWGWNRIARKVGGNTADSVRMTCKRYLDKYG